MTMISKNSFSIRLRGGLGHRMFVAIQWTNSNVIGQRRNTAGTSKCGSCRNQYREFRVASLR